MREREPDLVPGQTSLNGWATIKRIAGSRSTLRNRSCSSPDSRQIWAAIVVE